MRSTLSSEQQALTDATTGLLEQCASTHRRAVADGETAFDTACWRRAAEELGLPGVAVPEEHDGAGGSLLDAALVLEVAGRALSTLPLWTSIGAGRLLGGLADPRIAGELLAEVAAGTAVPGWVGVQPSQVVPASTSEQHGHVLDGRAVHVVGGEWLDQLLVIAQVEGAPFLYLVRTDADGVLVATERAVDPTRQLVTVTFDGAPATRLSNGAIDASALTRVRAEIGVLLAAEQVGTAHGALDMAVAYAKTREQFGRAIGSFQSLKHLLADSYVDVAAARDATRYAAWALSADRDDAALTAHLTRATVTPRVQRVCAAVLQVFGGIGYTWEHEAHLFYKRSLTAAHLLAETDQELDAIADVIGLG